jgi:hypothetical protein
MDHPICVQALYGAIAAGGLRLIAVDTFTLPYEELANGELLRRSHMKTKTRIRRVRFPTSRPSDDPDEPVALTVDDVGNAPCSEYIVMSQEPCIPALQEYLCELRERDEASIF